MISAVILHTGREPALALSLSRLVEGVLDGLIQDVAIADLADDPLAARLADEGGCQIWRRADGDPLALALAHARGDWLLAMPAGIAPVRGWTGAVREALMLAAAGGGLEGRIFPAVAEGASWLALLRRRPTMTLARRALAQSAGRDGLEGIARALRRAKAARTPGVAVDERARR